MMTTLLLPVKFLTFWYIQAPVSLVGYFSSVNKVFLQAFSLVLLLQTYFRPWKNEYRKDFIAVAIGIGIAIKTGVIVADFCLFVGLLLVELLFLVAFLSWPVVIILALFMYI